MYVKKHDSVRVEIPFDVNTFKSYDPDSGLYRIEGGEYRVFVSENYFNDKLTGTVLTVAPLGNDDNVSYKQRVEHRGKHADDYVENQILIGCRGVQRAVYSLRCRHFQAAQTSALRQGERRSD